MKTILFLFLGLCIINSSGEESYKPPSFVEAKYFGQHIHGIFYKSNKTSWPDIKFGTWRLWDAYVQWPLLESKKGQWDFSKLDKYVEMADQHNVEILLPLGLSPRWASARPDEKSAYTSGNSAEPKNIDDWRNYVRMVAIRYKGKIHHYELWNEVNLPMFYSGNSKKLVELAREMFNILKEIDSTNVVISPSITGDYGKEWLNKYLQDGGGKYADVIAYHFYVPTQAPEAISGFVRDVKEIMVKNGYANKQLWNTETGWHITNTDGTSETGAPGTWKRLLPDEAASYVARALILGKVSGIDRFYWYAWDSSYMGLIELKDKTVKPAGRAYGQVYEWLVGNRLNDCSQKGEILICTIIGGKGDISHLAWTTGSVRPWVPPRMWKVNKIQTLDGRKQIISMDEKINLTQKPTLFIQ